MKPLAKSRLQITYRVFKRFEPDHPIPVGFLLVVIPSLLIPTVHLHIPSLSLAAAATLISYYSPILFHVAAYRLSPLHPLAKYPGPIMNELSKSTVAYVASTGTQHIYYNELHKQYRDIVRIGKSQCMVYLNFHADQWLDARCSRYQRSERSVCKLCRCCTSRSRPKRIAEKSKLQTGIIDFQKEFPLESLRYKTLLNTKSDAGYGMGYSIPRQ